MLSPSLCFDFHFLSGVLDKQRILFLVKSNLSVKIQMYLVSQQHWNNKVRFLLDNYFLVKTVSSEIRL